MVQEALIQALKRWPFHGVPERPAAWLYRVARNLALASRGSGNIHVKIGPVSILEVIPCETPYGRIVLGSIVPEALPANHVQTITEVLIQTASPT